MGLHFKNVGHSGEYMGLSGVFFNVFGVLLLLAHAGAARDIVMGICSVQHTEVSYLMPRVRRDCITKLNKAISSEMVPCRTR